MVIFPYHPAAKDPLLCELCSPDVSGRICYETEAIWVREPAAIDALMTMAHEGGHWLSYLIWRDRDFKREQREWLAFNLGWYLLDAVGALTNEPESITITDWLRAHEELLE